MKKKKEEEKKEEKKELKQDKKSNQITVSITMGFMPVDLYKRFMSDVKPKYNDFYWVKLMDLMRKAEAYDAMVAGSVVSYDIESSTESLTDTIVPEQDEKKTVKTFGGEVEY